MHIFKYSVRKGTVAANMKGHVDESVKTSRSKVLLELADRCEEAYMKAFVGEEVKVLFEEVISKDDEEYIVGHNERYIKIMVPACKDIHPNTIKNVKIVDVLGEKVLKGNLI